MGKPAGGDDAFSGETGKFALNGLVSFTRGGSVARGFRDCAMSKAWVSMCRLADSEAGIQPSLDRFGAPMLMRDVGRWTAGSRVVLS